jgi:hypothetical protein
MFQAGSVTVLVMAAFSESDHPRASNGEFGSGGKETDQTKSITLENFPWNEHEELISISRSAGEELKKVVSRSGGPSSFGLTPDKVKNSPEFKEAYAKSSQAQHKLKNFNLKWKKVLSKISLVDRMKRRKLVDGNRVAMDSSPANREIDEFGRLHIKQSNICKAGVNKYLGREIIGWQELGLDPTKIYKMLRSPEEVEKAAESFVRLPILSEHIPVTASAFPKDLVVGTIGTDVVWNAPYLQSDLCFWTRDAITDIEAERKIELSPSYKYKTVMGPGTYEGQAYDGSMVDIIGNHLAHVEDGRQGSDIVVGDANSFFEVETMNKLQKAIFTALSFASPKLAADANFVTLVKGVKGKKGFNKPAFTAAVLAMDADIPQEQMGNVVDALMDTENDPAPNVPPTAGSGDVDPAAPKSMKERLMALLKGKVDESCLNEAIGIVGDEEPKDPKEPKVEPAKPAMDEKEMDKKVEAAMDSMRNSFSQAAEARDIVRPIVGNVDPKVMDAAVIYGLALDHQTINHDGIKDVPALKALVELSQKKTKAAPPKLASDANTIKEHEELFPGAARFNR